MSRSTEIDFNKYGQVKAIALNGGLKYNLRVTMNSGETESGLVQFELNGDEPKGLLKLLQEQEGNPWFAVKETNPDYKHLIGEVESMYDFLVSNRRNPGLIKYAVGESKEN